MRPDEIAVETARLVLRTPAPQDAAGALAMLADPDTQRWNPAPAVVDLDSAVAWCARGADRAAGDHVTWTVVDRATGGFCGNVSVHSIDLAQQDAEIGYRVAPAARGHRFGAEAVAAAAAWTFAHLGVVRIELVHAVANPASCAVAVRAGFPLEGVKRASFVYGDGIRHDEHLHARLAADLPPG